MAFMRAILIRNGTGPVENLFLGQAPKPQPNANEVLVKIKAFGLNRMDIGQRLGIEHPPPGASDILGVEFSGHVSEVGNDVSEWKIDDEVIGLAGGGAYAEYIAVSRRHIIKKPKHLSWVEAAAIPENFLTAFQALVLVGEVQKNDSVLVHAGASGVGVAAIQFARFYQANNVMATASTSEKLNWLLSLPNGATHAANYKTQDFAAEVQKMTDGRGVNVIIDFVGQSHWHQNIDSLASDGRMTILATLSGSKVSNFDIGLIHDHRLKIQGSTLRSRSPEYQGALIARFKEEVLCHITGEQGNGPIRTYIHKVYPWTDIQAATRVIEENKNRGKIVAEVV